MYRNGNSCSESGCPRSDLRKSEKLIEGYKRRPQPEQRGILSEALVNAFMKKNNSIRTRLPIFAVRLILSCLGVSMLGRYMTSLYHVLCRTTSGCHFLEQFRVRLDRPIRTWVKDLELKRQSLEARVFL